MEAAYWGCSEGLDMPNQYSHVMKEIVGRLIFLAENAMIPNVATLCCTV